VIEIVRIVGPARLASGLELISVSSDAEIWMLETDSARIEWAVLSRVREWAFEVLDAS